MAIKVPIISSFADRGFKAADKAVTGFEKRIDQAQAKAVTFARSGLGTATRALGDFDRVTGQAQTRTVNFARSGLDRADRALSNIGRDADGARGKVVGFADRGVAVARRALDRFERDTGRAREGVIRFGNRGLASASKALGRFDKDTDRTRRHIGNVMTTLRDGMAGAALAAAAAIVGMGAAVVAFGRDAVADRASAQKLADSLRTIPGITDSMIAANEDWISSMQLATHVGDTDYRTALEKLTRATGSLTKAQDLATLAADAAAGSGKSFTRVSEAMAKAASGNTSALKKLYPWLDSNKDGTLTLKEATDGLGKAYKGAAKKAADRDPWTKLNIIWDEIKESLGGALLPLLDRLGDWFKNKKNQQKVKEFIDKMGDLASEVGKRLVPALDDFLAWLTSKEGKDALRDMKRLVLNLADAASKAASAIDQVYAAWKKVKDSGAGGLLGFLMNRGNNSSWGGGGTFGSRSVSGMRAASWTSSSSYSGGVYVTEEQVARAVARILARTDARNGRAVRVI